MIERLMRSEIYSKDPVTNKYNTNLLSKLVKNFRSHPQIIQMSNDMFYDGDLIACASHNQSYSYVNWKELPVKGIPIMFDAVIGKTSTEKHNHRYLHLYFINGK